MSLSLRIAVLVALAGFGCGARAAPIARQFPTAGALTLEFSDAIDSPVYRWPMTLLGYPVDFSAAAARPASLRLTDMATGADQAFQLSDIRLLPNGSLAFAVVNFLADLPPGGTRKFALAVVQSPAAAPQTAVPVRQVGQAVEIDGGPLQVRVPTGRIFHAGDSVPGPILALDAGSGWMGESQILSGSRRVERLSSEVVEAGPLFCAYRLTYFFAGGARYIASIRVIRGYRHVEFSERMEGFAESDQAVMEMRWINFDPTRRFPANGQLVPPEGLGIDEPVVTPGTTEEPHWFPPNQLEQPEKDMLYRLAAFEGNAPRIAVPVMSFWEHRPGGRELSVFVADTLGWNDEQYMIWQPSTRLQVHFRYAQHRLIWSWPLVAGARSTALSLDDAARGEAAVESVRQTYAALAKGHRQAFAGNGSPTIAGFQMRYAQLLRSWYGSLSLDRVKDWVLSYPQTARPPPVQGHDSSRTAAQLAESVLNSQLMLYPLGPDLAVMNISHRVIRPMVEQYLTVAAGLSAAERRRVDAVLLLSAYLNAGEDMAPMRICVTGTPNMSADGFSVPSEVSVLFPDHPQAPQWRDQFQKIVALQCCYYTRPAVPLWGAQGGRWTESLAIYNWADLLPLESAQIADSQVDGRNRLANPWMALRAQWMVDELSAPVHNPDPTWRARGTPPADSSLSEVERQYPSHGAHGSGTGIVVPVLVPVLAHYLAHYDPIAAEHLWWAADQVVSHDKGEMTVPTPAELSVLKLDGRNSGTRPRLKSSKYTGHGIILRAGVGTPDEVSLHLDQIDAGPNYRWGDNGEGSSGTLFYFAGGKVWTAAETENTGDHANDDASGLTTFAVVKNGEYRSIGANVLDQPLYDLGVAQFGSIAARQTGQPYSWPTYRGRSVLLVGTDYFILADDAIGPGRFTWFTAKDLPFPKIIFLEPLATRPDHWAQFQTRFTKGIMRDTVRESQGSIALITHEGDAVEMEGMVSRPLPFPESAGLRQYAWARGHSESEAGFYRVRTPHGHDLVFRAFTAGHYRAASGDRFDGSAGIIRHLEGGRTELALFQGTRIEGAGLAIEVPGSSRMGISAGFSASAPGRFSGFAVAPDGPGLVTFSFSSGLAAGELYIDGGRVDRIAGSGGFTAQFPAGRHRWEFTPALPMPDAPSVRWTVDEKGGVRIISILPAGADRLRLQTSRNAGLTWQEAGESRDGSFRLQSLPLGKIHVRLIAGNAEDWSEPGDDYPVYVTDQVPPPPDGLALRLGQDSVQVDWGQILGAAEYRLYRRGPGLGSGEGWRLIYAGRDRSYRDGAARGVVPAAALPGPGVGSSPGVAMYEYAVAGVDGNGEGPKSAAVDTDPAGWLNWWPPGQARGFKRQTAYWLPPYVSPEAVPPPAYP